MAPAVCVMRACMHMHMHMLLHMLHMHNMYM